MSYILEALKKAEQARSATRLPDIGRLTLSAEEPVRELSVWLYGVTFLAFVTGATSLGWWLSGKPNENAAHEKRAVVLATADNEVMRAPSENPFDRSMRPSVTYAGHDDKGMGSSGVSPVLPPANARLADPIQADAGSKLRGVPGEPEKVVGKVSSSLEKDNVSSAAPVSASPVPTKKSTPSHVNKAVADAAVSGSTPDLKPSPGTRVLRLDELPALVRREVPKISTSGYVDSAEAGGRVVSINERSLREGDELIAGMRLEQIAQDYLLFSFRGYRFRVEMF